MNMNWNFGEVMVVERMREAQRKADRAQAVGLNRHVSPAGWVRFRMALGRGLVAGTLWWIESQSLIAFKPRALAPTSP
jgi:hypothetical protein